MSIFLAAVVVGGGLAVWRQSREAAALPARAAAVASLSFEPTGALAGPDGSETVLGTLRAPVGIERIRLSVLATSRPGCPVSAFTLSLAPTSPVSMKGRVERFERPRVTARESVGAMCRWM